jgi:hypothetical protein
LRVSDTDSDSGSPSRDVRRPNQIHTSASKYAATSCTYDYPGKSAMAMPQSEVSFVGIKYDVCVRESIGYSACVDYACWNLPSNHVETFS